MAVVSIKSGTKSRSLLVGNAYFQPTSFESIATITGTGSAASFTSIPQTYKHLQVRGLPDSGGSNFQVYFNNTAGTSYANHRLEGVDNGNVFAAGTTNTNSLIANFYAGYPAGILGAFIMDVLDYTDTSKNKTVKIICGREDNGTNQSLIQLQSGVYLSTSAVSTINFGYLATGAKMALYGIKG